jgi:hypothetical protein
VAQRPPKVDPPRVRKGQGDAHLSHEEFARRLRERFFDPAFEPFDPEIGRIIAAAWNGYDEYRKSRANAPPVPDSRNLIRAGESRMTD